jgi:hypothetical protein
MRQFDEVTEFIDADIQRHIERDVRAQEVDNLKVRTTDPNPKDP